MTPDDSPFLSRDQLEILDRIIESQSVRFDHLMELAGLDPMRDLRFANLEDVDFSGCNLSGYDFTGANLKNADFRRANYSDAIFAKADIKGARWADTDVKPIIFISFSHKDEPERPGPDEVAWLSFVQSFLAPVVKTGIFDIWVDAPLHGSDAIDAEVRKKIADCDIFVLLVSRHSLASTYVVETEIATIRQRQKRGEDVHIFPIVLSPLSNAALKPLKDLLLSPKDGRPLSLMSTNDREVAMAGIADDIAEVAESIAVRKTAKRAEASAVLGRIRARDALAKDLAPELAARVYVDTAHLPETPYERLVGREAQLNRLDEAAWGDRNTNIISLIAEGGAGKSALINEWLKRLRADSYRGAETVLGWSFYSQGTKERATSAEQFLNWAIGKLGIDIETTNATAKGEAIAEALTTRQVLLVLDGCEPLQHGLDKQQGELKDQGLRALLRRFAAAPPDRVQGLVVLTSRLAIKDIARWDDDSAPVVNMEQLSDEAGAGLLRDNGVWGTDKELHAAARDFGGHPLALGLLASFLKEKYVGDVRQRDRIRGLLRDEENPRHDNARRIMESYEKEWLAAEPVELAIMHMVGLFDRSAALDRMDALRRKPAVSGLTDAIINLGETEWQLAVARLREGRLLVPSDPASPGDLNAHPLVREWFGERLKRTNERAWKAAHGRLFEHLRDTTAEGKVPALEDLAPLYQAITHGCRAGRYTEALRDVYFDRICRRNSAGVLQYYSIGRIGAFGSDLAALSWFFERPYEVPVAALAEIDQSWLLGTAAFCLRALGRLTEALPAMRAALNRFKQLGDWEGVAIHAANVSESELLVGQISSSIAMGQQSVSYAERSSDEFRTLASRRTYANALSAAGQTEQAERLFADSERQQQVLQPEYPLLYAELGYSFCDLLLTKGDYSSVRNRATQTLVWAQRSGSLLNIALDFLILGRAHFGLVMEGFRWRTASSAARTDVSTASNAFNRAIDGLRDAGTSDHLPRSLLARANFSRCLGDWHRAARDLDEVEEIAEPGLMKLYLCDMALECARLAFAQIEAFAPLNGLIDDGPPKPTVPDAAKSARLKDEAAKHLTIAAEYINTCGYHRRDEELAELQAVLRDERKFADLPPRI